MIIEFNVEDEIVVDFEVEEDIEISFDSVVNIGSLPYYNGEYEVTPSKHGSELETKEKSMRENVKVLPITYIEVPNSSGGSTVTIGIE